MKSSVLTNTITQTAKDLRRKVYSSVELTQEILNQAKKLNKSINAFITISEDTALVMANAADKLLSTKDSSPLTGIPFCMKDAYVTENIRTTCASNVLNNYIPPYSATVFQKIVSNKGVLIGKNNQDAWGHGGSSENTDFNRVKNPWDTNRTAGGSSGGTAAAVAAGLSIYGIGEDTGGSIRNPSAYCNATGLKVTYGRVSRYGAIAYASSLDTVGPIAKTAEDCALVMETIAGFDPRDASSSHEPVPVYSQEIQKSLPKLTIGIIKEFMSDSLDTDIQKIFGQTRQTFESIGINFKSVSLPTTKYGVSIYYLLALSETSSNLSRYDGIRFGNGRDQFTQETMRRIMLGSFSLSSGYYDEYYNKALKARTKLIQEYNHAFSQVDVLLAPVTPFPPYEFGKLTLGNDDTMSMYLADLYTCSINPAGIPSLAFPAGFTGKGLPVGLQLIGPMFSESKLLQIIHHYQQITNHHLLYPAHFSNQLDNNSNN